MSKRSLVFRSNKRKSKKPSVQLSDSEEEVSTKTGYNNTDIHKLLNTATVLDLVDQNLLGSLSGEEICKPDVVKEFFLLNSKIKRTIQRNLDDMSSGENGSLSNSTIKVDLTSLSMVTKKPDGSGDCSGVSGLIVPNSHISDDELEQEL